MFRILSGAQGAGGFGESDGCSRDRFGVQRDWLVLRGAERSSVEPNGVQGAVRCSEGLYVVSVGRWCSGELVVSQGTFFFWC